MSVKKTFLKKILISLLVCILFFVTFVFARHIIKFNSGEESIILNETFSYVLYFNVTNNDENDFANITKINVSLPSGVIFNFNEGEGNGTDSFGIFKIVGQNLIWENETGLIMNNTNATFWFNVTVNNSGFYTIKVISTNASSDVTNNLYVNVSERIKYSSLSDEDGKNFSGNYTFVSVLTNGEMGTINIFLYNGSYALINSSSLTNMSLSVNFSGIGEGNFYVNASVNDTRGVNRTTSIRKITIDMTPPTISLSRSSSSNQTAIILSVSTSENVKGCTTSRGTLNGENTSITATGLSCDRTYGFSVTCFDYADNAGSRTQSFSTDECDNDVVRTNTGSQNSERDTQESGFWINTYSYNEIEFSVLRNVTKKLGEKERIKLRINGDNHYVGVISINSTSATINVSSRPQQATLYVGQEKKFEVTDDNYYDLLVKLIEINGTKAEFNIIYLNETVQPINQENEQNRTNENINENKTTTNQKTNNEKKLETNKQMIVFVSAIIILILAGAIVAIYFWNKKNKILKGTNGMKSK